MKTNPLPDDTLRFLVFYRLLIRLYPAGFRSRFAEEILQTIMDDLRYSVPTHSGVGRLICHTCLLCDLLRSIFREHFDVWRLTMRKKIYPLFILGVALVCFWVFLFGWAIFRAYTGLNLPDPFYALLGDTPSSTALWALDSALIYGPFVALILLLFPLMRVNLQEGNLMISIALQRTNIWHRLFLLLSVGITGFMVAIRWFNW